MTDPVEAGPLVLDPAMGPQHLGNVMFNLRIIPEYAATLDASVAFPAPGGRGLPLVNCLGNMKVYQAVQADLIFDPVGP